MKQSPFLIIQLWRVVISISGLEGYDSPLLTVIGPMPLILTCYGLIETASSILICRLEIAPSGDKQLSVTHSHTPSKVPFRTCSHTTQRSLWGVQLQWDVYLFFLNPVA